MVWDVERITGFSVEALGSAPGHVLDHEQGAVGDEDHVERGMAYDGTFAALNDAGERTSERSRWDAVVCAVDKDVVVCTLHPVGGGSVDSLLDVCAVEVDKSACGFITEGARESKDIPEEWAGCGDLVDVKARVNN